MIRFVSVNGGRFGNDRGMKEGKRHGKGTAANLY